MRKTADEVFKVFRELQLNYENYSHLPAIRTGKDELLETAMRLHEVAMKDEYFIKRKLAPNVDFWCVLPFQTE